MSEGQLILALDGDTSFDRDMVARFVDYFRRPGMVAVAGTLRVRNGRRNLLTRLQALDYALFRQLVRGGFGRVGLVNNIPGAHGAFRRDVLLCAGGWDNGTAEDVDLSLRLRKCLGRYPGWRLGAAPDVIGHTDVPERWGEFLRQRLRWEGDPAFLFLRKHAGSLRPATMGWRNWGFAMWYGLGFQGVLPLAYLSALFALFLVPWPVAAAAVGAAWGLHLAGCAGLLLVQVLAVSDRAGEDARLFWLLPLYSWFIFFLRAWSGVAVLHSLLARSERDSSMAPWWVLRKSRF
jgi:cellulose synthase/poly-beta-1,6-N-acetylglucosamine synthase-like glycosyltransferase